VLWYDPFSREAPRPCRWPEGYASSASTTAPYRRIRQAEDRDPSGLAVASSRVNVVPKLTNSRPVRRSRLTRPSSPATYLITRSPSDRGPPWIPRIDRTAMKPKPLLVGARTRQFHWLVLDPKQQTFAGSRPIHRSFDFRALILAALTGRSWSSILRPLLVDRTPLTLSLSSRFRVGCNFGGCRPNCRPGCNSGGWASFSKLA
jgi:hypothetical protein